MFVQPLTQASSSYFRGERGGGGGAAAGGVPEYDDAKYKTRPCKYFLQGHCSEGDNCRFIHPRGGGGGHGGHHGGHEGHHHGGHDYDSHRDEKRRGETHVSS